MLVGAERSPVLPCPNLVELRDNKRDKMSSLTEEQKQLMHESRYVGAAVQYEKQKIGTELKRVKHRIEEMMERDYDNSEQDMQDFDEAKRELPRLGQKKKKLEERYSRLQDISNLLAARSYSHVKIAIEMYDEMFPSDELGRRLAKDEKEHGLRRLTPGGPPGWDTGDTEAEISGDEDAGGDDILFPDEDFTRRRSGKDFSRWTAMEIALRRPQERAARDALVERFEHPVKEELTGERLLGKKGKQSERQLRRKLQYGRSAIWKKPEQGKSLFR